MRGVVNESHNNYSPFVVSASDQEPWNGAIKRSRTIFTDQNSWSRSQTLLQATCVCDYPCSSCMLACMPSVTVPLHGWMIVPCTAAVSLKINFARLQGRFVRTPSNPPWLRACYNVSCHYSIHYREYALCIRVPSGSVWESKCRRTQPFEGQSHLGYRNLGRSLANIVITSHISL